MRAIHVVRVLLPLGLTFLAAAGFPFRAMAVPESVSETPLGASNRVNATLYLEGGRSLGVVYVGPWATGAVRCVRLDGTREYVSKHRIVRVVDVAGNDVTRAIVVERKRIGPPDALGPESARPLFAAAFSHAPKRLAGGYAVTEVAITERQGRGSVVGGRTVLAAGVGGIANLSRAWGLGGVAHVATGTESYKGADLGLRVRRYLGDDASLDVSAGVWTADTSEWTTTRVPVFADASMTFADAVSFVVRVGAADWRSSRDIRTAVDGSYVDLGRRERRETRWSAGFRIGPSPRWISVPAFVVGAIVFLSPRATTVY